MKKKKNDFGKRLEALCKARGISANELSRKISVSSKTIYEWIGASGRIPRDPEHLRALSQLFSVSIEFLLFGEERSITIDSLISKTEIHTGLYEITIKKAIPKIEGGE